MRKEELYNLNLFPGDIFDDACQYHSLYIPSNGRTLGK
jgi:hypothetical protein